MPTNRLVVSVVLVPTALAIVSPLWIIWPIVGAGCSAASLGNLDSCGGRLERALDALQRDSSRRNRLDEEEAGIVYQQKLVSAPLEMSVSRIAVKLPQDSRNNGQMWARVDTCCYEPKSNALETRVMFNDLSVSGVISLLPPRNENRRPTIPAESCRMSLRLRRAGIEFYTNPIARGRGQMRIRTESSFLEPRFASIYAYGCRPTRIDKQIKRYDKWPQTQQSQQYQHPPIQEPYEAPEPRHHRYVAALTSREEDLAFANDETRPRGLDIDSDLDPGIWRKNMWVTRIPRRSRTSSSRRRRRRRRRSLIEENDSAESNSVRIGSEKEGQGLSGNVTLEESLSESRANKVGQLADSQFHRSISDEEFDERSVDDWLSREPIATEMEDVFLRGASQALTRYIERQLHPAIKETLMISMGYTISYG